MSGQRHAEEGLYVTPLALYREISAADTNAASVTETIDLSKSRYGFNELNLYISASVGDVFVLYTPGPGGVWYAGQKMTLEYANEAFTVTNVPASQVKVIAESLATTAVIHQEHTD